MLQHILQRLHILQQVVRKISAAFVGWYVYSFFAHGSFLVRLLCLCYTIYGNLERMFGGSLLSLEN
jgi:hypothetical protein